MKKIYLIILSFATCSQLISNDINWSYPPTTLSTIGQDGQDPQIAIDGSGNLTSAWIENGAIQVSSKPVNGSWSSVGSLSSGNSSSPRLVSDQNGNVTLIWVEGGVIKASSKPFGGMWSFPISLSTHNASEPAICIDSSGNVVVAWVKNSSTISTVTKLIGHNWSNITNIASPNATASPSVAIGGSGSFARAIIVWKALSGDVDTIFTASKPLLGNWSGKTPISNPIKNNALPQITIDPFGNATVVWFSYKKTGSYYYDVVVESSGKTIDNPWSPPQIISSSGTKNPSSLCLRLDSDGNGNVIAIWTLSSNDATFSIQSSIKPIRKDWIEPTTLVKDNPYSYQADIATTSFGDILALYMFYNGAILQIQSSESDISGFLNNLWSTPINLYTTDHNGYPQVAAVLSGNEMKAGVVWVSNTGSENRVLVSTGTKSIVSAPTNLDLMQTSNDFGFFTEYSNIISWDSAVDTNIIGYLIYRNGEFLSQVGPQMNHYIDSNQIQNGDVTYGVATINNQKDHSRIVHVSFP